MDTSDPVRAAKGAPPDLRSPLLRRLAWRVRRAVSTSLSGNYRSAFKGRGMEFDQVLKYQWGDDQRDIDWKVTARLGEPYRKRFVEERDLSIILVFEDSPALQFGSSGRTRRETLLETACLLMLLSGTNKDRVTLLYASPTGDWVQRVPPGRRGVLRLASRLLEQPAPSLEGPAPCELRWPLLRRLGASGSVLVWFGPFSPNPGARPLLWQELQRRYRTVGVRADDPWDTELPRGFRLSAYDPLAGRLTTIDTSSSAQRRAHALWSEQRSEYFRKLFPRPEDQLRVGVLEDPLQALAIYFRRVSLGGTGTRP
jgi:uncharacterized protein (DUF58 family)